MRRNYTDEQGFVTVRNTRNRLRAASRRRRRRRDWLKLPQDINIMILQKVGALHILMSAQFVCTEWRDICTDPSMWTAIRVADSKSYMTHQLNLAEDEYRTHVENMSRRVVDRSCGSLLDLDLDELIQSKGLLRYVVERCTQLRRLRGVVWWCVNDILRIVNSRLPLLEDLELLGIHCTFSLKGIETLGSHFPRLSSLNIPVSRDEIAKTIARSLPQLRHICFSGKSYFVTDVGVEALLDGCPHLETLDIRECFLFNIITAFQMMRNLPLTRTQWRDILDDPSTWISIRVVNSYGDCEEFKQQLKYIIQRAVDKSFGGLVDLDFNRFMVGDLLCYVVERCTQIRRLRGYMSFDCSEEALRVAIARLPLLEDLDLYDSWSSFSSETIETLGRYCPRLTSLKIPIRDDEEAKTLARSLPQLRHLKAFSNVNCALTANGVEALLDGCPYLKSLDLRECSCVRMYGTLGIRCAKQIKRLQCPNTLAEPHDCWSCWCCKPKDYQSPLPEPHDCWSYWSCEPEDYPWTDDGSDGFDDYNQFFVEEEVYDVNYTIDRQEEYWSRREKARCREALVRHLRRHKGNKNSMNSDTKSGQKARRRREFKIDSRREVKKEFVHWNKIATNPYTLYKILI